jgi:hypothetical protein
VQDVILILELKETKKTKNFKIGNWSACDFPAFFEVGTTWARPDLQVLGSNADWSPLI